jgi:hypothetical protein
MKKIIALIVLAILVFTSACSTTDTAPTTWLAPLITTAPAPTMKADVPTTVAKTWQQVITFEGSSIKTTQKFTIDSNNWRIKWSTTPGKLGDMNFQIYINDANGAPAGVAANIIGKGNDESYMTVTGEFSLTINTAQNYSIIVEQEK